MIFVGGGGCGVVITGKVIVKGRGRGGSGNVSRGVFHDLREIPFECEAVNGPPVSLRSFVQGVEGIIKGPKEKCEFVGLGAY